MMRTLCFCIVVFVVVVVDALLTTTNVPRKAAGLCGSHQSWSSCTAVQTTSATTRLFSSKSSSRSTNADSDKKNINKIKIETVDFWGVKTILDNDDDDDDEGRSLVALPCVPFMDPHEGPLPPGAYLSIDEKNEKQKCRITIGIDLSNIFHSSSSQCWTSRGDADDEAQMMKEWQSYLDAGFQSFQILDDNLHHQMAWQWIAKWQSQIPTTVETHWTISLPILNMIEQQEQQQEHQQQQVMIQTQSTRQQVMDILSTTRLEVIDTLLVPYQYCHPSQESQAEKAKSKSFRNNNSKDDESSYYFYYLDILDKLHDLQREGWIRSIGLQDWPPALIELAHANGLSQNVWNVHQQSSPGHFLIPPPSSSSLQCPKSVVWWTNPLPPPVLLSMKYLQNDKKKTQSYPPPTQSKSWHVIEAWYELREQQQKRKKNQKPQYNHNNNQNNLSRKPPSDKERDQTIWQAYVDNVLKRLQAMSQKHEVPPAMIILRWALQQHEQNHQQQQLERRQQQRQSTTTKKNKSNNNNNKKTDDNMFPFISSFVVPISFGPSDGSSDGDFPQDFYYQDPRHLSTSSTSSSSRNTMSFSSQTKAVAGSCQHHRRKRQQLRSIFRFALDEQDLEDIQEMIVRPIPYSNTISIDDVDVAIQDVPPDFLQEYFEQQQQKIYDDNSDGNNQDEDEDDYPEIDFSNQSLWL